MLAHDHSPENNKAKEKFPPERPPQILLRSWLLDGMTGPHHAEGQFNPNPVILDALEHTDLK
jgi:hypothetical protein